MVMSKPIKHIVVLGDDVHAWSAAAYLSASLVKQGVDITVIESAQVSAGPMIYSMGVEAHEFHRRLQINEADLMTHIGGAYKYGTAFHDWLRDGERIVDTYSPVGEMMNRVHFHHYLSHLRELGHELSIEAFSISSMAALAGKFAHPKPGSLLDKLEYTYQLHGPNYLKFLKFFCGNRGVKTRSAELVDARRDTDNGNILALVFESGAELAADFYIDASSSQALLIGGVLAEPFTQTASLGGYDTELVSVEEVRSSTPLLNEMSRQKSAWVNEIALPGLRQRTMRFNSQQQERKTSDASHRSGLQSTKLAGWRAKPWSYNCLAIGDAATYLEPVYRSPIQLTHSALELWLSLYPATHSYQSLAEEYNRLTLMAFAHTRDVHALVLSFNEGLANNLPDSLHHRLTLFKETGRVAFYEADVLDMQQWAALLMRFGIWPQRTDVTLPSNDEQTLLGTLQRRRDQIEAAVSGMPKHDDLLAAIRQHKTQQAR